MGVGALLLLLLLLLLIVDVVKVRDAVVELAVAVDIVLDAILVDNFPPTPAPATDADVAVALLALEAGKIF